MTTGKSFYKKLDESHTELSNALTSLTSQVDKLTRNLNQHRGVISHSLREIARIQAEAVNLDQIRVHDALTQQVEAVSAVRDAERSRLQSSLASFEHALVAARTEESKAAARLATAQSRRDSLAQAVEQALAKDDAHRALKQQHSRVIDQSAAAHAKAASADAEMKSKLGAYEADRIFQYLHLRRYGTPDYRANPIVRAVDGWLASLCGYREASRDYDALRQLPSYLLRHAQSMDEEGKRLQASIRASQSHALRAAGADPLDAELAALAAARAGAEEAVSGLQGQIQDTYTALSRLNNWQDQDGARLLKRMANIFSEASIEELERRVAATLSGEDDELLSRIRASRQQILEIEHDLRNLQPQVERASEHLEALTSVKRKFKSKGYDSPDYTISKSGTSNLIEGFLLGSIATGDFWHAIEMSARHQPTPRHTTSSSSSYSSGSSHSSSNDWSSDSGSFSTGGGFGGGGSFSTGGGF